MAEPTKPAIYPDWATNGGATQVQPPAGVIQTGFTPTKPPYQFMNWILGLLGPWTRYFSAKNDILPGALADTILTIAAGVVTPTQGSHQLHSTVNFTPDILTVITPTNFNPGRQLMLRLASGSGPILIVGGDNQTLPPASGQILLKNATSMLLDGDQVITLQLNSNGDTWTELARSSPLPYRPQHYVRRESYVPLLARSLGLVDQTLQFFGTPALALQKVAVGTTPYGVAVGMGYVFVSNAGSNTVSRLDKTFGRSLAAVNVGVAPHGMCFDGQYLYVCNSGAGTVSKIEPYNGTVVATITVGTNPEQCAVDALGRVWVTNNGSANVSRINTNGSVTNISVAGTSPWGIAYDGTFMWVTSSSSNNLSKISQNGVVTNPATTIGAHTYGIAFDGVNMWVGDNATTVYRYNITSDVVTPVTVGNGQKSLAFDGKSIFSANTTSATISRIDLLTLAATSIGVEFDGGITGNHLAWDGLHMWAASSADASVRRFLP